MSAPFSGRVRSPVTRPCALCLLLAVATAFAGEAVRPAKWAKPLKLPGVASLHRVDDGLYRGAQPTKEGMRALSKMGVKTIVSFRAFHSDRDEIGSTPLTYVHIPLTPLHLKDAAVVRFLKLAADRKRRPVFFHCLHGADRTGVMCAAYRIAVQGWAKDEAIREMTKGGFGHHSVFGNLAKYLREADFERIRRDAGLTKKSVEPQTNADERRHEGKGKKGKKR